MDFESYAANEEAGADENKMPALEICSDVSAALTYASWQNSVPLLRMISITNQADQSISDLTLKMETQPAFAQPKKWTIDRITADGEINLSDRNIVLDPEYLSGLNEAERGIVRFSLIDADNEVLVGREYDVRLLARDEWGGFLSMPSLIAAFVMPNDPAVAKVLKEASKILGNHGHSTALDGYQSNDPRRAYMLVAAIWSAVGALRLTYAEPPKSFEKQGQKVRRPSTILDYGLATCLDTTLLFTAAVEAVGLNSAVLVVEGHSFAGVWLKNSSFPSMIVTEASEVRKAIAAREFITFETSMITQSPPATFEHAVSAARAFTSENEEENFVGLIDLARARANQIRPLASHQSAETDGIDAAAEEGAPMPLPSVPDFAELPEETVEVKPSTPAGRIERWQRKLLDLSLRNRLLNFRETKQTVPFLCPDVPYLEDRLADGARIRIISLPDQNPLGDRDETIHRKTTGLEFDTEFALQSLKRDELSSPLEKKDLDVRLTELYRRARNDLNEGGSNTLFLAVGFLRWKKTVEDQTSYRAPLLLVPIKLERRSASSAFFLTLHEDEVRFNATLVQMLKRDFDLDLSHFEGELPLDDSGIDVPLVLERMRRAVRDVPSFEVVNETALSTFSFAKYLMWKDLVDRTDDLRNNRIVRHLIDNPDKPFEPGVATGFPLERDVDRKYHPKEIVCPLPADSSQLAAVLAAAEGQDFVLIGPPGTGKSQTITNMIAQCLANGKSVLFVAEKTAALNVVHRRLQEHGLGEFCLELHSNKAERKRFFAQLRSSWEAGAKESVDEWIQVNEDLRLHRDELNDYVDALHEVHPNGFSCFSALAIVCRGVTDAAPELSFSESVEHDAHTMLALRKTVRDLAVIRRAVRPLPSLAFVKAKEWSMRWQTEFLERSRALHSKAKVLDQNRLSFASALDLPAEADMSFSDLSDLLEMAKSILIARGSDLSVAFNNQFEQLKSSVADLEETVERLQTAENGLAARYTDENIRMMPVERLQQDWREAEASVWPMSWLGQRRVRKLLASYASDGKVDPVGDLRALAVIKSSLKQSDASELGKYTPGWKGARTNIENLRGHFEQASAVKTALTRIGKLAGNMDAVVSAVSECVGQENELHPLFDLADAFHGAMSEFLLSAKEFRESGGAFEENNDFLRDLLNGLDELQANAPALQAWTEWQSVAERANALGLGTFVSALDDGLLQSDDAEQAFELAYARWWLPRAMHANRILRQFKSFQHQEALRRFRELDDRSQSLAASQVRRKLARKLPRPQDVPRRSELGLLRHQMELQRPSKSIREMIGAIPEYFGQLAPCVLMSPLSIAQYLPSNQAQFDLVIFDEASQITTWDAVGSIARGNQAIIVGDPRQLPPTNFFGRTNEEDEAETYDYAERDLESILDEAKASGLPEWRLNWHYRSRNESLIAFSNWHYYENRLVTFPSPRTVDDAVSLNYLPAAIYDRGKSRTNRVEADAIVKNACAKMRQWLSLPDDARPTLGVITFNSQQQSLIQDLFDAARRDEPELEWFFSDERFEPTMVRNLENVQGDERDVMYFSITFGPDHAGKRSNSFGAINKLGGERRLNVAVTRARQELYVFSSTKSEHIDIGKTKALGVAHLKTFLDFADRGSVALPAAIEGSVGGMESPFEEAVAAALGALGWTLVPQVGVSQYRIDLGVVHPDKPGSFLAGLECDGATYHRSATARDRDKIREAVLRGLGWSILRIWSPDWWYDAKDVSNRIDEQLRNLLEESRESDRKHAELKVQDKADPEAESESDQGHAEESTVPSEDLAIENEATPPEKNKAADLEVGEPTSAYIFRRADLSGYNAEPDRFYETSYSHTIQAMIQTILEAEAPIRDDVLAQRIARAHGWLRTGASIRAHVDRHTKKIELSEEEGGRFFWREGQKREVIHYRHHATEDDRRPVGDIALVELAAFVRENQAVLLSDDPALAFARSIGLSRLAAASRERLEKAIKLSVESTNCE